MFSVYRNVHCVKMIGSVVLESVLAAMQGCVGPTST